MTDQKSIPSADVKKQADEVLDIVQEAIVAYTVSFFTKAVQPITKAEAENIVSKIGLRIAIKNETLAYAKP